jgi:para-aminobenzoate synthetase component I
MFTATLPWHWHSVPLKNRTGSEIFAALFLSTPSVDGTNKAIATLLESPTPVTALARYSICAGAPRIINGLTRCWTPANGEIFSWLSQLINQPHHSNNAPADLPFTGGWLGWLGYEAAWELEKLPTLSSDPLSFPVAYWYEPANFAVLDHQTNLLHLAVTDLDQMEVLLAKLQMPKKTPVPRHIEPAQITYLTTAQQYQAAVRQVQEYIQAGDIYQANLSVRFTAQVASSGWADPLGGSRKLFARATS